MTCVANTVTDITVPLAVYLAPSIIGFLLLVVALPLSFLYWRRLATDVANYKQMWHKRRWPICIALLTPLCSALFLCHCSVSLP